MALLAIDQGTTSTRAIVFDDALSPIASAQREFRQIFPRPGWVEHDPEDIWATAVATAAEAMARAGLRAADVAGLGVTNQRETVVVWERATGKAIHNAIVWQDRRTAETCARMKAEGLEPKITAKTGLVLDPYFSATKLGWILDHVEGARARAEAGEFMFGTVDAYLIWRLTGGTAHATDATNAARTLLYDIRAGRFDDELCAAFGAPAAMLPEVRDSSGDFGETLPELFGGPIRILGVAGDQQAATVGQACFRPGMAKVTYGTGAFALLHTGEEPVASSNKLLTTVALQLAGRRTYALEGAIFVAGAAVQWLRDGLKLIREAAETQALAEAADPEQDVYLVPAFVGLGAPHWDAEARAALIGLTRGTGQAEIARAALESVGYQTADLVAAMRADWPAGDVGATLRVDGGMTASDWTLQFLADILDAPVDRPEIVETTALGAAYLAGLAAGVCPDPDGFAKSWRLERRFEPRMDAATRRRKLAGWADAVARVKSR
ncbi:glycerol kinase GlpK [Chelatococcus sambhunathii]|uniref:Glycerol kinase n=1 Tax=Chelatococcus sambhunathii TaxID=363953 RepID=A0ABU1DKJ2_9HYPH|nr:glycerol kinase GlpK [Chelatococcus sambhunathii]MDR4308405.1 glycerol kinase GlpK [Chelatococcus sambhunathii]